MLRLIPYGRAFKHHKLECLREEVKASPSQLYKEVESLKHVLSGESLSDAELWKTRQELCHLLESLLLLDLDYALDKKVEQDLWSFIFRNPIAACQSKAKEQKSTNSAYSKSQFTTLLETASGFYLQLLQKLCCAYDIDLPCHPRDSVYGLTKEWISCYPVSHQPRKTSLFYICQHCLVHLGDIARYRGQSLQAENFYRHAVDLVPCSGQPYNQLALLEAASGEKLSTVFFYVRSLSVQHPFPPAATNLQILFSKLSYDVSSIEGKMRITAFEYISLFLQFHAAVHQNNDLKKAQKFIGQLTSTMPALIIAEKFETWQLVQMVAVCLFAIDQSWGSKVDKNLPIHESYLLSSDELKAALLIEELLGGFLYAFLLPLHASPEPKETAMYYTLPAVKIILDWILQEPKLLLHEPLNRKHQIWHALCKLLNDLDVVSAEPFDAEKFEDIPLPEDWDLQCFLPLKDSQRHLKFNLSAETPSDKESVWLRAIRLCKLGEMLSDKGKERPNILSISHLNDRRHFKAVHQVEAMTEKVLQQIQEFSVTSSSTVPSQVPSLPTHIRIDGTCSTELVQSSVRLKTSVEAPPQQEVRFKLDDNQHRKDKFVSERDDKIDRHIKDSSSLFLGPVRRMGKNVAIQAILQQHQANQNQSNILARNSEFRKDPPPSTLLQPDLVVRPPRPTSRIEGHHHIRPTADNRVSQVPEMGMNRPPLHHMTSDQYNSVHSQQASLDLGGIKEREPWIQSYNMHQNPISNVSQVVHNSMSNMGSYLQNPMSHIIQPSATDFSFQQNQSTPQHMVNKSVSNPQSFLSNPPSNIMWNYMNFMTPYQQACGSSLNPSSHTSLVMQSTSDHQPSNSLQQQSGYYLMNHPKVPSLETPVQSNMMHSIRTAGSAKDSIISNPNADIFQDKLPDQPIGHSFSTNVWKLDSSHSSDHGPSSYQLNQNACRAVGQTIQSSHPSQLHDCGNSSSATITSSHDLGSNTYSLFNSPWPSGLSMPRVKESQHRSSVDPVIVQPRVQSLWSGPGPSALERLLEQQKQRRDASAL